MLLSYRNHAVLFTLATAVSAAALAIPGCGGDSGGLGDEGDTGADGAGDSDAVADTRDSAAPRDSLADSPDVTPDAPDTALDSRADTSDGGVDAGDGGADTRDSSADTGDSGVDSTVDSVVDSGIDTTPPPDTAPPPVCYATNWCVVANPAPTTLWDIWGTGPSNVYAVGNDGAVIHYDGTTWVLLTTPIPTSEGLFAVWGSSASDIYVGAQGTVTSTIYHFNGSAWTTSAVMPAGSFVTKISGSSAADVWAVGTGGGVMHFNGTAWTTISGFTSNFVSVLDVAADDTWVFPSGSTPSPIRHWTGAAFVDVTNPTTKSIFDGWAAAGNDIYNPLFGGGVIHWDGTAWSNLVVPAAAAGTTMFATWGSSATDVWVVGASGSIINGSKLGFTVISAPDAATKVDLTGVIGFAPNNIWAVGVAHTILHYTF